MATPEPSSRTIYRIKITLSDVDPPIWRRVEIEDCSLETLHGVIQDAMGWENYHLYEFDVDGVRYTDARAADADDRAADEMTLAALVARKQSQLRYLYDFGDNWNHLIEIEGTAPAQLDVHYPRCTEGQRACPPEDCGGPWGYGDLLSALDDPEHEEHDDFLEWIGDDFDPEAFDPQGVNRVWASWDFSNPDSGPNYGDEFNIPSARREPKGKRETAKSKSGKPQSHVGRNDPCPCGSGKKYKRCCLRKGKKGNYDDE